MSCPDRVQFRPARPDDAEAIASLHTESWRRHYRGAYSDSFLDGDVIEDRLAVWTERLQAADLTTCTILAEESGRLVGFAHTIFDHDPIWGALLDNLHVAFELKRHGIGSHLMVHTSAALVEGHRVTGLYLWALEQNVAARAFYEAMGGSRGDRVAVPPPGGVPGRLCGAPFGLRYSWPQPSALIASRQGAR
jgi:ribosomal protein S18 acetylase RimI-like enzyme